MARWAFNSINVNVRKSAVGQRGLCAFVHFVSFKTYIDQQADYIIMNPSAAKALAQKWLKLGYGIVRGIGDRSL